MNLNTEQIRLSCDGQYLYEPVDTNIISNFAKIDSRKVEQGDMFVAINGENANAHKFIPDVIEKKASTVICEENLDDNIINQAKKNNVALIKVDNSIKALQDIACQWRKNISATVIGITGSVGKTSTKKIIYDILSSQYKTTANAGNYNNEIGLPITICESSNSDDFLVTEMGMSAFKEIETLCDIAKPDWALITNIGESHMEFLGSKENIAKAKSEIAFGIPDNSGKIFLPMNDEYRDFIIEYSSLNNRNIKMYFFGDEKYNENFDAPQVWYENVSIKDDGSSEFDLCCKGFKLANEARCKCNFSLRGFHNIINACAAVAISLVAGINLENIINVLNSEIPEHGRQEFLVAKAGFSMINDAYNASPQSMVASLSTFKSLKCEGKKIAFLGDMFELGAFCEEGHRLTGKSVAQNNIDNLICVGDYSKYICSAANDAGMDESRISHFDNIEDAQRYLLEIVKDKDCVLFKASNSMGFQDVVSKLAG